VLNVALDPTVYSLQSTVYMIHQSGLGHSAELLSDDTCVRWTDSPLTVVLYCIVLCCIVLCLYCL